MYLQKHLSKIKCGMFEDIYPGSKKKIAPEVLEKV